MKSFSSSDIASSAITSGGVGVATESATKLLEAIGKVADSLAKAGLGVATLAASVIFAGIAGIVSPTQLKKLIDSPAAQSDASRKTPINKIMERFKQ
jgi:hypothetical protein